MDITSTVVHPINRGIRFLAGLSSPLFYFMEIKYLVKPTKFHDSLYGHGWMMIFHWESSDRYYFLDQNHFGLIPNGWVRNLVKNHNKYWQWIEVE